MYTEELIYWKVVKHQSNVLNKKIKNKSANEVWKVQANLILS